MNMTKPLLSTDVNDIYKERKRLKKEQNDIQNNIRNTIDDTDRRIRSLKNEIKYLEDKKKTLIIEYNKECDSDDRIRGSTPPQFKDEGRNSPPLPSSPKSFLFNIKDKSMKNIKTRIENENFIKMVENVMEEKLNTIQEKIDLQNKELNKIERERELEREIEKDREREKEKELERRRSRYSAVCGIM